MFFKYFTYILSNFPSFNFWQNFQNSYFPEPASMATSVAINLIHVLSVFYLCDVRQLHRITVKIDIDLRLTLGILPTGRPERSNN